MNRVVVDLDPAPGGIGTGRQMAAAMALGADGVWTGSIWLTVSENTQGGVVTDKLLAASSTDTVRSCCLRSDSSSSRISSCAVGVWVTTSDIPTG